MSNVSRTVIIGPKTNPFGRVIVHEGGNTETHEIQDNEQFLIAFSKKSRDVTVQLRNAVRGGVDFARSFATRCNNDENSRNKWLVGRVISASHTTLTLQTICENILGVLGLPYGWASPFLEGQGVLAEFQRSLLQPHLFDNGDHLVVHNADSGDVLDNKTRLNILLTHQVITVAEMTVATVARDITWYILTARVIMLWGFSESIVEEVQAAVAEWNAQVLVVESVEDVLIKMGIDPNELN